jgi:iron complex outermembrane receptor protein
VYLTLGSKLEHNSFTGYEVEPSARIAWYPDNKQTWWAAVSRAVRTPGIAEESWLLNVQSLAPGVIAQQQFNPELASEELVAYELGYRVKPVQNVSLDSTAFINDYSNLTTYEPLALAPAPGGYFYQPFQINRLGAGHAYGFEESATWDVTAIWNLKANYSYINLLLDQGTSQDPTFKGQSGDVAHHQFMLRSQLYLPHDVRLVNTGYYVGSLPNQNVDPYFRFDTQAIWKATEGIELSLDGQNLLEPRHAEFGAPLNGVQNEIPRAVYGRITIKY